MENLIGKFFRRNKPEGFAPKPIERRPEPTNPLERLGGLIGGGNVGEVGVTVFEIAAQLHQDNPELVRSVERSRDMWSAQTQRGANSEGAVGNLAVMQASFDDIAKLEPGDSSVLYIPGGSGIARLFISRSEQGLPKVEIDEKLSPRIKARFIQLDTHS